MKTVIRLLLGVLLVALPAAAQAWTDCGDFSTAADLTSNSVRPGTSACHDTTGTTDSAVLNVKACEHFSVQLDPDVTGSGTGCEAYVYRCTQNSSTSCIKVMDDTDGDGIPDDVTLTGDGSTSRRNGFTWLSAPWIYIDVTANPSGHSCRVLVDCK